MTGRLPVVAVVGRPNVGKSTFFNRVIGRRLAIVDDRPGVTRDRNFARADWAGSDFFIVDTGGVIEGSDEKLDLAVREQALTAVDQADVILFLVDGRQGVHALDERLADVLRKTSKPVLLVANKIDNLPHDQGHHDFWSLGIGEPIAVSALSGKGSGDLLDRVLGLLPESPEVVADEDVIRVAVVGKPNVGKSSFVNRLVGEDRVVVSETAGTTRDPVDTEFRYHAKTLVFVDTAGLRRQAKVKDSLEYYSALRTDRVVHSADVCVLLVDASEDDLHAQDIRIAQTVWGGGQGSPPAGQQVGPRREGHDDRPGMGEEGPRAHPLSAVGPDRLHLGAHWSARPDVPRSHRRGERRARATHRDTRSQRGAGVPRAQAACTPSPGTPRQDQVRYASVRGSSDVRHLLQLPEGAARALHSLSPQRLSRRVDVHGHSDPSPHPERKGGTRAACSLTVFSARAARRLTGSPHLTGPVS